MLPNVRRADDVLWERFYRPDMGLFYEYDPSDASRFPSPEEVAARIPNTAGWKTGMEDCCLNGGAILDGYVSAFRVTNEQEWADKAREVFHGLLRLGDIPQRKGFVARGFAPGRTDVYPNSSADQYTTWFAGVWAYASSSLADDAEKVGAARLVANACRLIESFNHDIPTMEMKPSIFGDTSAIAPDRSCRILMFYRIAHDLTGDTHWLDLYMRKLEEDGRGRLRSRFGPEPCEVTANHHAHFQSQIAWTVLAELEDDPTILAEYLESMVSCARHVVHTIDCWRDWPRGSHDEPRRWRDVWKDYFRENPDVDYTDPKGRQVFTEMYADGAPGFMNDLKAMRNPLDALAICMLCPDQPIRAQAAERAAPALESLDFSLVRFGTALACLGTGYWRGVEAGHFPQ